MPELIVTDSAYEFVPPYRGRVWPWIMSRFSGFLLKRSYGVTEVEIRGQERLQALLDQEHGVLLAPNHCRMADALVMQSLSKSVGRPFFFMASAHLFRGSKLLAFALRRFGAFSVYREGIDRDAVEAAIQILDEAARPLVIFPEGVLSQANEHLNPLMEGVSFISRKAARNMEKAGSHRQVFAVPICLRYLFQGDVKATVGPILTDIEQRLSWRPSPELPLVERIYRIGGALLGLKEMEYMGRVFEGDFDPRLKRLIDHLLVPLEDEYADGKSDETVVNRVKELRRKVVPDMIDDKDDPTRLSADELQRRWRQLEDMEFAQALSLFPAKYVASRPTVDRILETVERIDENLSGEETAHPPMKVVIQIGEPIPVAAKRARRNAPDPLLAGLETQLRSMLEELGRESPMFEPAKTDPG